MAERGVAAGAQAAYDAVARAYDGQFSNEVDGSRWIVVSGARYHLA